MPTITLDQIEFAKSDNGLDLSAPLYRSRIYYEEIEPKIPAYLQVEPAFQFVSPPAIDEPYFFDFIISENGVEFSLEGNKLRWEAKPKEATIFKKIEEKNSRHCRVTIDPAALLNETSPRVMTLRLYCSLKDDRERTNSNYGVNLVLLKPGGDEATNIQCPFLTNNSEFTVRVTEINKDPVFPRYHIFKYEPPLPPGISLEPVFRISRARPTANVAIELAPNLGKVFHMNAEDVAVQMRNSPWPSHLAKPLGGNLTTRFSADSAAAVESEEIQTFSFFMELDDSPVSVVPASLPSSEPEAMRVRSGDVSPTVVLAEVNQATGYSGDSGRSGAHKTKDSDTSGGHSTCTPPEPELPSGCHPPHNHPTHRPCKPKPQKPWSWPTAHVDPVILKELPPLDIP